MVHLTPTEIVEIQAEMRVPVPRIRLPRMKEVNQQQILRLTREISQHSTRYSKNLLRKIIFELEKENVEIDEELYEKYIELISQGDTKREGLESDRITYCFYDTDGKRYEVMVDEKPNILSDGGTTGLRTWEASIELLEYLLTKKMNAIIQTLETNYNNGAPNVIMELGTGTGLVGIFLMKYFANLVNRIVFTDHSDIVLAMVKSNLQLNGIDLDGEKVKVEHLDWCSHSVSPDVNMIIGCDITYDADVIVNLSSLIGSWQKAQAESPAARIAFIAATVRNEATLDKWENLLKSHSKVSVVHVKDAGEDTSRPPLSVKTGISSREFMSIIRKESIKSPVKIYQISSNSSGTDSS